MPKDRLKLVEVTWLDADCEAGWGEYEKGKPQKIEYTKSYGLLVEKGEHFLVLSMCKSDDDIWMSLHRIPNQMVKKVRVIETL